MAYSQDLANSARRHLAAASKLVADTHPSTRLGSRAVAGYLYGLAGELALKELMRRAGLKPIDEKNNDPFYAHFPDLRNMLSENLQGRRDSVLLKYAQDSSLFQFWDIKMRYAPTSDITEEWTDRWRTQAEKLLQEMDTF